MRTGRYRVRPGLFGRAVLQAEYNFPSLIGGQVDASVRSFEWVDVQFDRVSHIVFEAREVITRKAPK